MSSGASAGPRGRPYPSGGLCSVPWDEAYRQRQRADAAEAQLAALRELKDAKIAALESTVELLRQGMIESCRDDRYEAMGGCVYAAALRAAARDVVKWYDEKCKLSVTEIERLDALTESEAGDADGTALPESQ